MTQPVEINARAQAPARDRTEMAIRAVRTPEQQRRVPLVLVEVEHYRMRLTFAVARLRGGEWEVRPPRGPDGTGDGVWLPACDRERLSDAVLAAVKANPEACAVLER